MAALREQILAGHSDRQAGRHGRAAFVTTLTQSGVELSKVNKAANKERRRSLMATLTAYIERLGTYEKKRKQEASRLHKTRIDFVANLSRTAALQRKANTA